MLNSIILLGGLVSAFGLGAISPNQEKQDNNQFRLENHKSVQYDDVEYQITFTVDELNNYHWDNFYQYLLTFDDVSLSEYIGLTYNGHEYTFDDGETGLGNFCYQYDEYYICFNYSHENNKFEYELGLDGNLLPFEYNLVFTSLDSDEYDNFKSAIELDIQANQPSDNIPQVMNDFISVLISGISQLAGGLANGIVAMASGLFLSTSEGQVTGLSLFGGIIAIFAGLALAVTLTTKVYTWVTSLGN